MEELQKELETTLQQIERLEEEVITCEEQVSIYFMAFYLCIHIFILFFRSCLLFINNITL